MIFVTMPKLSDTMTEGRLIRWHKTVGEQVVRGDVIAEVETDKASMELEAFASGLLLETRIKPGELVKVGTVIGVIGSEGETPSERESAAAPLPDASGAVESLAAESLTPAEAPVAQVRPGSQAVAAPVVRRKAREMGIELSQLSGSGPGGRVLLEDLERFQEALTGARLESREETAALPSSEPAAHDEAVAGAEHRTISGMRGAIARTVELSWKTIPHFSVTVEIRMDQAEEVRRELKRSGAAVSLNDMIVKTAALALQAFPLINSSYSGDAVVVFNDINIGIAVSLTEGLLVPVIKGCQALSLREIAERSKILVQKSRAGGITAEEISGGTFTISNLGMYGASQFSAVILPPQAAILAIGGVSDTVIMKSGIPAAARIMKATLSADHRVLDGAYAAGFLGEVKKILENPVKLLL